MEWNKFRIPKEFFIDGSLALKRNVLLRKYAILLNLCMLPTCIYWFTHDNWILASSQLLFLLSFNSNIFLTIKGRPFIIAYPIVMLTWSLTLFLTVYYVGFAAALWLYPIVIGMYFVVSVKAANYSNFILITPIVVLLFFQLEVGLVVRYCASIGATIVLGVGLVNSITNLQKQLLSQSRTDPLTGAYNRRHMDVTLSESISQSERLHHPHTILMLDIDYFKKINDDFGHEIGDIALQDLVILVKEKIRKTDTVFRMGGVEFILLLRNTDLDQAQIIAEHIRESIQTIAINNSNKTLSVSIGVSLLMPNFSYSQWLSRADTLLYEAKRLGRNQVVY
ncbi:MAG: GGDEF domain-containing protein [Paraglaciecola sp.]|nr:GGDEF domain-containing protein [Paraglaciecola sp.]